MRMQLLVRDDMCLLKETLGAASFRLFFNASSLPLFDGPIVHSHFVSLHVGGSNSPWSPSVVLSHRPFCLSTHQGSRFDTLWLITNYALNSSPLLFF
jgi:hypothetical protein